MFYGVTKKIAMKTLVLVLIFVAYVSADCGCLKCSKHLQGVDIIGPNGRPIKVVFKRPQLQCCCKGPTSYTPIVQVPIVPHAPVPLPGKTYNYKVQYFHKPSYHYVDDSCGHQYSATIQAPLPTYPKAPIHLLNNLKYRTDTVLIPTLTCKDFNPAPASADQIKWTHPTSLTPAAASGPIMETLKCCSCERLDDIPILTGNDENNMSLCPCKSKRNKRSLASLEDKHFLKLKKQMPDNEKECGLSRNKRDLAKHGYNFLLNMLPQYVREPLHHSIKGVHVEPTKPKLSLKQRLEQLATKKAVNIQQNLYGPDQSQASGKRNHYYKSNVNDDSSYFQSLKPFKAPTIANKRDRQQNFKFSFGENKPESIPLYSKAKGESSGLDSKFKYFAEKYQVPSTGIAKFSPRAKQALSSGETILLKKLKKLNNNPFSSNIENQATDFMMELLLKPEERSHKRTVRSTKANAEKELVRNKRTIILGSDEIDIPTHYEVDLVSIEDEEPEDATEDIEFSEEDESPFVGDRAPPRRIFSGLPKFSLKPDVVVGKNVIQKAVRDELESYHKKLEKEQKIKDMRANLQKKRQTPSVVPHNPIFMLLTAPMKFLKHFHDINKGVNPVMTSLPKLVYTTKKYFRDFGKNFHKNCLNLASDVIGDFDHIQPNVIQQISNPEGRRYRRDVLDAEFKKCLEENREAADKVATNTENPKNAINGIQKVDNRNSNILLDKSFFHKAKESLDPNIPQINKNKGNIPKTIAERNAPEVFKVENLTPDESSKKTQNFREVSDDHVRKKRYVIKVVDDHEIQDQVEEYLTQKMGDQLSYHNPLQDYYDKVNEFVTNLYSSHQPLCKQGEECFYHRPATYENPSSFEDSFELKPKKKKIQIKKLKPRVIIDKKGLAFMEYDGFKRPLLLKGKKFGLVKKSSPEKDKSSEETGHKIATLIARAKEDSEVVGSAHKDIIPQQIVKERISSLLEEIDQLVHLNAEDYDDIFENLIKTQQIKMSIEQDWKRILMDSKVNDLSAKIGLLSKLKDLQQSKDDSIKCIAKKLEKTDNAFVRRQLVHSLIRLQKLQCLITSIVEDFEQILKMKTSFNTKKEIKYVDFLSELTFVNAKTRNDLVKKLCKDRDAEGQKNIELLHKLKKLLVSSEADSELCDNTAKLLWEMKNLERLQQQTIQDMDNKLSKHFKIKKELKILFDLQKRFDDCEMELNELLGNITVKATAKVGQKKDVKEIIAEIKQKHEKMLQRTKERAGNLHRLKNS